MWVGKRLLNWEHVCVHQSIEHEDTTNSSISAVCLIKKKEKIFLLKNLPLLFLKVEVFGSALGLG